MAKKPTKESVYEEVRKAGEKGKALSAKSKIPHLEELLKEGKIKKVGSKYYLPETEVPLTQKQVTDRLLSCGYLKRSGKKFIIRISKPAEIPSYSRFLETLQRIYLRKTKEYRKDANIVPLAEELAQELSVSKSLVEKWILELPKIFIGTVDLRSFPGESGIKMEDGTEISRIYLERGIVGL